MLNAWRCEICGADIGAGEDYLELPNGTIVCSDISCLLFCADRYWTHTNPTEEELRETAEEENYEQEREARQ